MLDCRKWVYARDAVLMLLGFAMHYRYEACLSIFTNRNIPALSDQIGSRVKYMENINDSDLKKIVDEVVTGIMREMPSRLTLGPTTNPVSSCLNPSPLIANGPRSSERPATNPTPAC